MRTLAAAAVAALISIPGAAFAIPHADAPLTDDTRETLVQTGTLVRIAMKQTVTSSRNKAGDAFSFTVVDDVKSGDRVAIPAGTAGTGKILQAAPAHGGRVDGVLRLHFDPLVLADGTDVSVDVTRESLVADQNEHNGMAGSIAEVADIAVPGFFLIDFLRKGDDVTLAAGAPFHVAVMQDAFLTPPEK